jgi:hypothetical protein
MLASVCVVSLMALCALLLRTQALLSSSRSANFDPRDPSNDSNSLSPDLTGVIVLTLICLTLPVICTVWLYIFLNSSVMQQKWLAFKSMAASRRLFSSQKAKAHSLKCLHMESPRIVQSFQTDLSASRTSSPFKNARNNQQPAAPSQFIRPSQRAPPVPVSKRLSPSAISLYLSEQFASGGSAERSSPSHATPLPEFFASPTHTTSRNTNIHSQAASLVFDASAKKKDEYRLA